jgi:hypothetical protein
MGCWKRSKIRENRILPEPASFGNRLGGCFPSSLAPPHFHLPGPPGRVANTRVPRGTGATGAESPFTPAPPDALFHVEQAVSGAWPTPTAAFTEHVTLGGNFPSDVRRTERCRAQQNDQAKAASARLIHRSTSIELIRGCTGGMRVYLCQGGWCGVISRTIRSFHEDTHCIDGRVG